METATAIAKTSPLSPNFGLETEEEQLIVEKPIDLAIHCVVFIGDMMSEKQKRMPLFRLGGMAFPGPPEFYTIRNNNIPQCGITRLHKGYRGIHKNHIPEKEQQHWIASYKLTNHWNPETQSFQNIEVGTAGMSLPLLYKEIKPINEIGRITRNGVVALNENCGIGSGADIREAQLFYFPNWLSIVAGSAQLPETLIELQDHIDNRREQAYSNELRAVGDAYLQSCSDFYDFGRNYTEYQSQIIKETEKWPGGARYDELAERMFRFLGLTREDKLVQNFASNQADQQTANKMMVESIQMMAQNGTKMDSVLSALVQHLTNAAVAPSIPLEAQPPAPTTIAEAQVVMEMATEDDTFTDMTEIETDDVESLPSIKKRGRPFSK